MKPKYHGSHQIFVEDLFTEEFGILEHYLGRNLEFLGESWNNHGLGLALSAKKYIQNVNIAFRANSDPIKKENRKL
jgi:threonine dehydratase